MSKIIKASGSILFETDTGYASSEDWKVTPNSEALRSMLGELVRVLVLNGEEHLIHIIVEKEILSAKRKL